MSAQAQNGVVVLTEEPQPRSTTKLPFIWKLARGFVWGLGMIHLLFGGWWCFQLTQYPSTEPFSHMIPPMFLGIGVFYVLFGVLSRWLPRFSLAMLTCVSLLETAGVIAFCLWAVGFGPARKIYLGFASLCLLTSLLCALGVVARTQTA